MSPPDGNRRPTRARGRQSHTNNPELSTFRPPQLAHVRNASLPQASDSGDNANGSRRR